MNSPVTIIKGTPLMKAFLVCMTVSGLLLVLLVSGVLMYLSNILKEEAELAAYVLPNLQLAHQFSSATAGMQSQGQLLRSAATTDDLIARDQLLRNSIRETRILLEEGSSHQGIDSRALTNTVDQIQVVVIALFGMREKQLIEADELRQETSFSIAEIDEMHGEIQSHVVQLSGQLLDTQAALSTAVELQSGVKFDQETTAFKLREFGKSSLNMQEYLLFGQDLERLKSLVQRLPLLGTSEAVTQASQQRDLLVQTMKQRIKKIQSNDTSEAESGELLSEPLSRIVSRLAGEKNLFESAHSLNELSHLQNRLNTALTSLTEEVPAVAEQIRSQSEFLLVDVFDEARRGLEKYRWVLLGGLGLSLLMLASVSYWLVYRQTVLPLGRLSGQLDSVGTDSFRATKDSYFIQEMADLSVAVNDLDQAHKEMQHKDVKLKVTNKELRRANEDLEQFAHVASHDLQEPLRMLQQFSGLLEEDYHSELDGEGKFYIEVISSSAHRMSNMIRDTLEYAKSSQTSQSIANIDLEQILELVIKDKEIIINETAATITVGKLPSVFANATGMRQLFGNLLANAIKYRREDTPLQIFIEADYSSNAPMVDITVRDNGVGIESKFLERVFTPFERLNDASVSGTGLGLAICTKVCESHDWSIDVSSEVGIGSSFRIRIPLTQVVKMAA